MTWFKVDDGFYSSRKVLMIPRANRAKCLGVWVQAGSWSAKELTDGHVPGYVLDDLGGIPEERDELIRVGLWESDEDGGIIFHNWHLYQPSREQVKQSRGRISEAKAKAGKIGGLKSGEARAKQNRSKTEANSKQNEAPTRPDPTSPSKDGDSASRIPKSFVLTEAMTLWAEGVGLTINLETETAKFVDYWTAESGPKASKRDWVAAWRNWMRRAQDYRPATADVDPWAGKKHLGFDE